MSLATLLRNLRHPPPPAPKDQTFDSFEAAAAQCGAGYDDAELAEVVFRKTLRLQATLGEPGPNTLDPADCRLAYVLQRVAAACGHDLRVLDFGGACGAHYFQAARELDGQIARWHVVETPVMAARTQPLADDRLRFFDTLDSATAELGQADLLFSSGAIQYTPDYYATLDALLKCDAAMLYLARLPLLDSPADSPPVVLAVAGRLADHGPGPLPDGFADRTVRCPTTFASRAAIEQRLATRHELLTRFLEGPPQRLGSIRVTSWALLARRR